MQIPAQCARAKPPRPCPGTNVTLSVGADSRWHGGTEVQGSLEVVGRTLRFTGGNYSGYSCTLPGTYTFAVRGTQLTVRLTKDPCPTRRVTLVGVWRRR